ncbi:nuclear transport factor 2 family protein [Peribacillus simplex]
MESSLLKEHLHLLEEKLLKPAVRTSPEELSLLLKDDFFEFGSSGNIWSKSDFLGQEGAEAVKMTLSQFDMHPLSEDTVLTTYRIFDEDKVEHSLRSSIWKCTNGRWQMFFHQGTKTKWPR